MKGLAARIRHLYTVYTVLDTPLVARALGVSKQKVSATLGEFARAGRVKRHNGTHSRRPYCRRLYILEEPTC